MRIGLQGVLVLMLLSLGCPPAAAAGAAASGWPLTGPIRTVRGFDPPTERWRSGHRGIDLAASPGQLVLAAAAGTVTVARQVAGRGVVAVDHGGRRTTYEPVSAVVTEGQRVQAGTVLGQVAVGGHCSGRCLHWGLKDGEHYLDPLSLVTSTQGFVVRLMPAAQRAVARTRAAARAVAAAGMRASLADPGTGPPGSHAFMLPVAGPVTSAFGARLHPVLHVWRLHDGTDFQAACGAPIRAPHDGKVAAVLGSAAYGNRLMLDHGVIAGRAVRTGYNHASRYVVHPGQRVRRGQLLGYVGTTGRSTGCHLHLMVWLNGRLANPMTWFGP